MATLYLIFGTLGALGALGVIAGIVGTLAKHQQRMAEIMQGGGQQQTLEEIGRLREEVADLKRLVHRQIMALGAPTNTPPPPSDADKQKLWEHV